MNASKRFSLLQSWFRLVPASYESVEPGGTLRIWIRSYQLVYDCQKYLASCNLWSSVDSLKIFQHTHTQVGAVVLVQPDEQQCTSFIQALFLAVHV